MKRFRGVFLVIGLLTALGAACQPAPKAADAVVVRMALLPILDALPVHVALQEGLFTAENVRVEVVPVGSGPERDQLLAGGQADGMINELVSTLFFNKDGVKVQTVRYARVAASGAPLFTVLAGAESGVGGVSDLAGKTVAVSDGTIIAYVTERMLAEEGVAVEEVQFLSVPKLDARLALLTSGGADAVVLPEPLASLAAVQGAVRVLDDAAYPDYSFSTYTFRKEFIDSHPEAVRAFLRGLEKAVTMINQAPEKYAELMLSEKLLPKPLEGKFEVPHFAPAGVPTEVQFADAQDWATGKGYLKTEVKYADSVTGEYLP